MILFLPDGKPEKMVMNTVNVDILACIHFLADLTKWAISLGLKFAFYKLLAFCAMIKVVFMVYIFSISSLFSFLFVVFISAEDHTKREARFFIQPQHTCHFQYNSVVRTYIQF